MKEIFIPSLPVRCNATWIFVFWGILMTSLYHSYPFGFWTETTNNKNANFTKYVVGIRCLYVLCTMVQP